MTCLQMSRTFRFQHCGAAIEGTIGRAVPPISGFSTLNHYAAYITTLCFSSPMTTCSFNSPPVQNILSKPFPELLELKLWVEDHPSLSQSGAAPLAFETSELLQPRLQKLSLNGVPLSTKSSLGASRIRELELRNYPPSARPLEWSDFASILGDAWLLEKLVIRAYTGRFHADPKPPLPAIGPDYPLEWYEEDQPTQSWPWGQINPVNLRTLVVEDTPHNTVQVARHFLLWFKRDQPYYEKDISFIANHHSVTSLVNRQSSLDQESMFVEVVALPIAGGGVFGDQPDPPGYHTHDRATLVFGRDSITLECTGPTDSERYSIQLRCPELPLLDPHSRTRVHAMAIKSAKWHFMHTTRYMHTLEIVDVDDGVRADAWNVLLESLTIPQCSRLHRFTLVQNRTVAGHAATELQQALYQQTWLQRGLKVCVVDRETGKKRTIFKMPGPDTIPDVYEDVSS